MRRIGGALLAGTLAVSLAACGTDDDGGAGGDTGGELGTVRIGFIPAWTDGLSMGHLLKNQIEKVGYTVEIEELGDNGPLYAGLAQGDLDLYTSAWPEKAHKPYMDEFGDRLESVGAYYDNSTFSLSVPSYSELQSVEDLPDYFDELDGRIVGIEPGAGLTDVVNTSVIPAYGLENFEHVTSSTTAMLAELNSAVMSEEEIVVTMWSPFWAISEFDLRPLEEPQGAFGEPESLHTLATAGWSDDHPELAEWIGQVQLDDAEFGSLEYTVVNDFDEGDEQSAIEAWLEENPDVLPELPEL
ncbi:MAG: glycine betaine ABC transporter substrate-binding protein [Propionibacterium sp.]|nr:glycine betaine ABC transporter substrate-binding protein [Propionibacterium sp.]